jgi:undecaprenyl diphosphate synthase
VGRPKAEAVAQCDQRTGRCRTPHRRQRRADSTVLRELRRPAAEGRLDPRKLTEERFRHFLDEPDIPDVDLFVRSSGEQRTSNFLLWQSAYAELVFLDRLWPDFDRRDLWRAIEQYASRDRRYGGAVPNALGSER